MGDNLIGFADTSCMILTGLVCHPLFEIGVMWCKVYGHCKKFYDVEDDMHRVDGMPWTKLHSFGSK